LARSVLGARIKAVQADVEWCCHSMMEKKTFLHWYILWFTDSIWHTTEL